MNTARVLFVMKHYICSVMSTQLLRVARPRKRLMEPASVRWSLHLARPGSRSHLGTMFAAHGAPASMGAKPAFSAAPPVGDARLPRPVPKRRWSIDRLEALFSGRAPASAGEPKPTSVEKQKSVDPDSASSSKGRRMTRWSSAPAESNLWRHGRQFQMVSQWRRPQPVSPEGQGCSFAIRSVGH